MTTQPADTAIRFSHVVLLQDEDGREVTDALFNVEGVEPHRSIMGVTAESVRECVERLSQWDMGEDYNVSPDLGEGRDDLVIYADGGEYVLVASMLFGQVALYRIVREG